MQTHTKILFQTNNYNPAFVKLVKGCIFRIFKAVLKSASIYFKEHLHRLEKNICPDKFSEHRTF